MKLRVWLNDGKLRKAVDGELMLANAQTCWVKLPNGKTVKRKLLRDFSHEDRLRIETWRQQKAEEAAAQ